MTNDNVVDLSARLPLTDDQTFMVSVATIQGCIADMMEEGTLKAIGVVIISEESAHGLWTARDGDPVPLLGGAELLKARILASVPTEDEDIEAD